VRPYRILEVCEDAGGCWYGYKCVGFWKEVVEIVPVGSSQI
jgi:hypothetical protein